MKYYLQSPLTHTHTHTHTHTLTIGEVQSKRNAASKVLMNQIGCLDSFQNDF